MTSIIPFDETIYTEYSMCFYIDGVKYYFLPKEDITPYEVALLIPLFATTSFQMMAFKYVNYIKEKNLMRHFSQTD